MNLDILIFQQINGWAGKWVCLDALGVFFAEYLIYILGGIAFLLLWKNRRGIFWAIIAVILARFGIAELIRLFWSRPRPFIENNVNLLVEMAAKPSFPSGHAAICFALSTVIFLYYKKVYPRPKFWWGAGIFFFIASFLVSIARVFVGVHWPLDIVGGVVVGVFSGWLVIKISQKF